MYKIGLTYFTLLIISATSSAKSLEPMIHGFNQSACIKSEEKAVTPSIKVDDGKLVGQFWVNLSGGQMLVNPSFRGFNGTYTFYMETAHPTGIYTGCLCKKNIEFTVGGLAEDVKKVYIVIDDLVWFEIVK